MTLKYTVTVACAGCGACLVTCPERAIRVAPPSPGRPPLVVLDACTGCGECAEVCPVEACVPSLAGGSWRPEGAA
jgi:NAD-dependent dihydropyrimidine dehydrogenase PreA subunit